MSDDGMSEIIAGVRAASDRTRTSLYVTTVASILILAATYNTYINGWPMKRMDTWYSAIRALEANPKADVGLGKNDISELKALREAYLREFVSRAVFTASPLPGVSIDINNLGFFGGVTLILLMMVVVASVSTEHESVYVALQDVVAVNGAKDTPSGTPYSAANLLYQALVMTQVLSVPPTRVRWRRHTAFTWARLIFFAPTAVYAWVVWTEWAGRHLTVRYGVNIAPIIATELCMLAILVTLSFAAWLHSRAMAVRWIEAFRAIHPKLSDLKQESWRDWLKI
jgi:hypothetical protein